MQWYPKAADLAIDAHDVVAIDAAMTKWC